MLCSCTFQVVCNLLCLPWRCNVLIVLKDEDEFGVLQVVVEHCLHGQLVQIVGEVLKGALDEILVDDAHRSLQLILELTEEINLLYLLRFFKVC